MDLDNILYGPASAEKDALVARYTMSNGEFDEVSYEADRARALSAN